MRTITIELLNENALSLLQQLEQLNILRLVQSKKEVPKLQNRQWAGSLSEETTNKLLQHTEKSRNEWERNI